MRGVASVALAIILTITVVWGESYIPNARHPGIRR